MKKIMLKNRYNQTLVGIFDKKEHSQELILICHGSRSTKNSTLQTEIAQAVKQKFNTYRVDFSGNGESQGKLENSTYSKDSKDLIDVIRYFQKKGYTIRAVISYSKSSSEALLISRQLKKLFVQELIVLSPRINLYNASEWKEYQKQKSFYKKHHYFFMPETDKKHKITKKYLEDIKKYGNIKKHYDPTIKTTIIHGTKDDVVDISEPIDFCNTFKNVPLIRIKDAHHNFNSHIKELNKEIIKILN